MNNVTIEQEFYVVSDSVRAKLADLHRRRDEQAFIAGCAVIGQRRREAEIIIQLSSKIVTKELSQVEQLRNLRLGVLYHEFLVAINQCERLIRASETDEQALGEHALRSLGLNPDKEELRIDIDNGMVLKLTAGAWEPYKRS